MPNAAAAPPTKRVPNAFSAIPYPRSIFIWWRPYQTILTEETAIRIRSQLDGLSTDGTTPIELDTFLGNDITTAFLFPVLASEGDNGAVLLRRMLDKYSDGRKLDDRWLLIVFALGCNDSDQVISALRQELRRIQDMFAGANPRRTVDAKLPIIDALSIALARRGTLTYAELGAFSKADPERAGAIMRLGLNYAHAWMSEKEVLDIIYEALKRIDQDFILRSLESGEQESGHLRALRDFLLAPRNVWPIGKQALLGSAALGKHARDFVLVIYLFVMTHHAQASQGIYDVNSAVADKYLEIDLSQYPQGPLAAYALLGCTPSSRLPMWERYLENLAKHIQPQYLAMADGIVRRSREMTPETKQLYDPDEVTPRRREPGIYLYGFTRAGGMMLGGEPGSPKGQQRAQRER